MEPNRAPSWNSTPNSLRTSYRSASRRVTRSRPWMRIEPASGLSRPTSVLRNTDLPVPDGPSITEISPAGSIRLTSRQMTWRPKDLVSPSTTISTPTRTHLTDGRPAFGLLTSACPPGYARVAPAGVCVGARGAKPGVLFMIHRRSRWSSPADPLWIVLGSAVDHLGQHAAGAGR